jgi:release factor glutamine methyltransferase
LKVGDTPTLLRALEASSDWLARRGSGCPRLEAELLACKVLAMERLQLYLSYDRPLTEAEAGEYRELVRRRGDGEPVAYLVGHKHFHAVRIPVGPGVLIPRPESEMLVELGLAHLRDEEGDPLWLDLCTGSGCVAVAVAVARPELKVVATDVDEGALEWAKKSVAAYGLGDRVALRQGDLYEALPERFRARFSVMTANPPYISRADPLLDAAVRRWEPDVALFAEGGGLAMVRRVVTGAAQWLAPGGLLVCEIGFRHGPSALSAAQETGFEEVQVHRALAGHDRVLTARAPAAAG